MLRNALLGFALLLAVIGSAGLLTGHEAATPAAIWGFIILIAVVFERWRYHKSPHDESGDWQKTGEQFIDPESGQPTEVLYNPQTGERQYKIRKN